MRQILMLGLLWLCQAQNLSAATSLVELVPVRTTTEHLLLIFPGGKVAPEQYQALALAIDQASEGRVAVVAARFSANLPNPLQVDARIESAKELLIGAGIANPEARIFLAGHSDGGIMGHAPAAKHRLAGLILLGSYIPRAVVLGGSLAEYSLPVMMMMGDRDGHTGINFLARELLGLPVDVDPWQKSVLLIRGANHMQMADGSVVSEDLPALASLAAVHAEVASNVVDFIDAQGTLPNARATVAREKLAKLQHATKSELRPFSETWTRHETLCADGVSFGESAATAVPLLFKWRTEFASFLAAKPAFDIVGGNVVNRTVPTYIEPTLDPFDISINRYVAPPAVACRYKSGDDSTTESSLPLPQDSCAALNMQAVSEAVTALAGSDLGGVYQPLKLAGGPWTWSKVSDGATESSWNFGPITLIDRRAGSLLQWLGSPVKWERNEGDRWLLEITHWRSEDGTTHCKLIAPLKVVEWATTMLPKVVEAGR